MGGHCRPAAGPTLVGDDQAQPPRGDGERDPLPPAQGQPVVLQTVGEGHQPVGLGGQLQPDVRAEPPAGQLHAGDRRGPGLPDEPAQRQLTGVRQRGHIGPPPGDRGAPAGRAGAGADHHARGGVPFPYATAGVDDLQQVAGGLVGAVADVHLVEADQLLAVVEDGADHGAGLGGGLAGGDGRQQPGHRGGREADQDPGVAAGLRVDPDHRLPVEVLGDVGHEPVRPDRDDDVLRSEEEPGQVVAVDLAAPPVRRHGGADRGQRRLQRLVPGEHLVEVAAALAQVVAGRRPRAVADQQLVELAAAAHHDDAGGEGGAHRAGASRVSRSVTTSGVTVS